MKKKQKPKWNCEDPIANRPVKWHETFNDIHIYRVTHLNFTQFSGFPSIFVAVKPTWQCRDKHRDENKNHSIVVDLVYISPWSIAVRLEKFIVTFRVYRGVCECPHAFVWAEFQCVELSVHKTIFGNLFFMAFFPCSTSLRFIFHKKLFCVLSKQNSAVA